MSRIKIIAFDADDTLWANESFFQETEADYCRLFSDVLPGKAISEELLKTEMHNLSLYGYGAKGFTLSMIETALRITGKQLNADTVERILQSGKNLLDMPIELLPDVKEVLMKLKGHYKLVVATKGDLLDQKRKLSKSGLTSMFDHIEIMSDKQQEDYEQLISSLNCQPNEFLMVGNSLKSDIEPVLAAGGYAVYIPFHITWAHEKSNEDVVNERLVRLDRLGELLPLLRKMDQLQE